MGVGPMNLVITNDALYQLSYTSVLCVRTNMDIIANGRRDCKPIFANISAFVRRGRNGPFLRAEV